MKLQKSIRQISDLNNCLMNINCHSQTANGMTLKQVMSGIAGIDTLVQKAVLIPKIGIPMRYRKVSIPEWVSK